MFNRRLHRKEGIQKLLAGFVLVGCMRASSAIFARIDKTLLANIEKETEGVHGEYVFIKSALSDKRSFSD